MLKILLDENIPHKLRAKLVPHNAITVQHIGWGGLKNGELLKAAEKGGFDVFVTGDKALEYQQNLAGKKLALVSLSTNNWPIVKNHVGKIAAAVSAAKPGTITRVDIGVYIKPRNRPPNPPITAGEVCAAGVEAAKCCAALHFAGALAAMEGEGLSS